MHGGTCDGTARHYAHIPMYRPSSTRAEMYAILASLYPRTPVRLGLDNLSAVRGMNKLLASDGGEGARPWGLARDGDLWCKIAAILRARGVQSFAINKLKGHCDRNMIDNGTISMRDYIGNDNADRWAKEGRIAFGPLERFCAWLDQNLDRYAEFLANIRDMMVRIAEAHGKLRKDPLFCAKHRNNMNTVCAMHPPAVEAHVFHELRRWQATLADRPTKAEHGNAMLCLIFGHEWAHAEPGISWLELLALYTSSTRAEIWIGQLCDGSRHCSVQSALQRFKQAFLQSVALHVHPEARPMFTECRHARLRGLGFWSIVGAFCGTPRLNGAQWQEVWRRVLWLRPGASSVNIVEWMTGKARLEALSLKVGRSCPEAWGSCEAGEGCDALGQVPDPYAFRCITPCPKTHWIATKPKALNGGGWPKWSCF